MDNILSRGVSKGLGVISAIKLRRTSKNVVQRNEEFVSNLRDIQNQIDNIQTKFNMTDDENLIDALIYEEKAMKSKYAYLLNEAKRKGVKSSVNRLE